MELERLASCEVSERPAEILQGFKTGRVFELARDAGMSVTGFLDRVCPYDDYRDGFDSFERLMHLKGIRTRSIPSAGLWADRVEAFDQDEETRGLAVEWATRIWRSTRFGGPLGNRPQSPSGRSILMSDDETLGTSMRPYVDMAAERIEAMEPSLPISEIVALNTPIQGDAIRSVYLTEPAVADVEMRRVPQGAPIPLTRIEESEHVVRLYKYGRGLELTYEVMRRRRIDLAAFIIARIALQTELDQVAQAILIAINGDGNPNTAATVYNLLTLDPATTVNNLTVKAYLAFKMLFKDAYNLTTMITRDAHALSLALLNLGSANIPLFTIQETAGFGSIQPINKKLSDAVSLGIHDGVPANRILGLDKRFAVERLTEIGADIQEAMQFVNRQTRAIYLSEVVGFDSLDANAVKVLRLDA